ncbi:hypothetical protein DERP_005932 [Dermatophagoides pteronyssinus]|uniref:Uncharacterized protein n=1 Tax=Dermatophagoides pteronyssinus TaxID=6956 RepID=A0ABQ8JS10_DERPT|nr:hypothetical protein DERP_005932 [Dermatophagoides pteronyssinus]
MIADEFLNSPDQFSSLPARTVTNVPSLTSHSAITLNDIGNVLLDRQCIGNGVQIIAGEPVRHNSPGCSFITSFNKRSPGKINSPFIFPSLLLPLLFLLFLLTLQLFLLIIAGVIYIDASLHSDYLSVPVQYMIV